MKLYKSVKENEVYYYFNSNNEKLWMFRHKYYDSTGKRKEKKKSGFQTEKAAIKALLEVKAQTLRGETKQLDYEKITVGEWLDIWYETNCSKWKVTTKIQRLGIIKNYLKPYVGHHKLQKLDRIIYQKSFINKLEGKFKASTIRLWHTIFKIAINAAVDAEILSRNRFNRIALPADSDKESLNYFTSDELATFLNDIQKNESLTNYMYFLVAAYTGMRKGEICGLQWKNINFNNQTVTIERTRDHKGIRLPKTKNSYRTILIDTDVMKQLEHYKTCCKEKLFSYGKKLNSDTFVFINDDAVPIFSNSPNHILKKSLKRTGLPKITVHGLRHTHCTLLLNEGRDAKVISERLGNTPEMIYKVYGHIMKQMEVDLVTAFSQSLEASGAKIGAN
ncbi:site-specific integrase [Lysinibacillus sp. KU-BSD001]|uniref:site-specific integrase n=1 Tax=Lysinibacillus sp. KU-BSD001 TaxID=3141328 RepID=UPI0036DFE7AA